MVRDSAMYYRTNILKAARIDSHRRPWDEYRKSAKALTANGAWGTMILSKQGIEAATRLNSFYQQAGGDIVDGSGRATIDTDAGQGGAQIHERHGV